MTGPILAKDIMVKKLITLSPEMGLRDAANLLMKNKISGAPVVDSQGKMVGVFSEKDVMRALIDAVYDDIPSTDVGAYMSRNLETITEETDILTIAQIFLTKERRRLPVLRGDRLVGQISRRDVMHAVIKLLDPTVDRKTAVLYISALREPPEAPLH